MAITNDVVIRYSADITNLEKSLDKLEAEERQLAASGKNAMKSIETGAKNATDATKNATKQTSLLGDKLKEVGDNLPFANQIKQVTDLGGAVTGLGSAAGKSSAGFQILKVAIASTGIGLLIVAVVSLIAYFKRTDEGATKLSGVMSGLGAAMDLVTGFVVGFGESVFNALTSVDRFLNGLSNLGDFLANNLLNRLKAPLVAFEALQLAIGGDFKAASLKFLDATTQLATGITDITSKADSFIGKAVEAAEAMYKWEVAMDALQDKMREDSIVITKNEKAITNLIIASKNKQIADEESLALLGRASKLEEDNFNLIMGNEKAKLKLIQEKNTLERNSINQDKKALTDELALAETTGKRKIEILKQLRSVNDSFTQEEVDQINKITNLEKESANLKEKIKNREDQKKEEIFQNELKRLSQIEIAEENSAKERFLNGTINAEKLEQELFDIKIRGLEAQKKALIDSGRETVEVDKAILDLRLTQAMKSAKALSDQQKKENDEFLKMVDERIKEETEKKKLADKEELDRADEHKKKMKIILSAGLDIAADLVSGFYDISQQKRQADLEAEMAAIGEKTDAATTALQTQLDNGIITQEQFNARKKRLEEKQAQDEAAIKKKQFQADKKASLVQVAIDTAVGIIKAFAQLGPVGGLLGAALVTAQGLAQAALISSQPTPKFKDGVIDLKGPGTGTSDSIPAMLSKGESVMTAEETRRYRGPLEAMREGTFDYNKYSVSKAMEESNRASVSRREADLIKAEQQMKMLISSISLDTSNLERRIKDNKNVGIKNTQQLAKDIAREAQLHSNWYK